MRNGLWRLVECADTFTMRAHSAARSSGIAVRTQRIMPMAPSSIVSIQSASVRSSIDPRPAGPVAFTRMFSEPHRSSTTREGGGRPRRGS